MRASFKQCFGKWIGWLCLFAGLLPHAAADCGAAPPDLGMLLRYSWQVTEDQALPAPYHIEVNTRLETFNGDALRAELDSIGHVDVATPIALLIQNLRRITRLAMAEQHGSAQNYARSEGFQAMRNRAYAAFEILCHDDTSATLTGFPAQAPEPVGGSDHLGLAELKRAETLKADQQRQIFARVLIVSWFVATIGLVLLHFSMLFFTTRRRSRHLCKIPASLEIATQTITGHVDILGRFGCRFMPDTDQSVTQIENIEASMHCVITITGKVLSAKTISDALPEIGMQFSNPLEVKDIGALLEFSLTKPKLDLSATSSTSGNKLRFGKGRLPV